MMDSKKDFRRHLLFIVLILLLVTIFYQKFIFSGNNSYYMDHIGGYYPRAEILKQSIEKYGDILPLWNPYTMSGTCYFCKPTVSFLNYLIILFPVIAGLKLALLLEIVLSGIAMYSLVYYMEKNEMVAFISSIVYMFNGWIIVIFSWGHLPTMGGYAFIPLIILFTMKAVRSGDWLKYSILTGMMFSLQILIGPDLKVTLWTAPMFGLYLLFSALFSLTAKNFSKKIVKIFLIGLVVSLVVFGATAVKTLTSKEYLDLTSRAHLDFEHSASRKISGFGDIFNKLIEPLSMNKQGAYHIGIVAFLLSCAALVYRYKNKNVLWLWAVILFSVSIATGSFVFYLLWKYAPLYDSFRYLPRALNMFAFSGSVLAGLGASALVSKFFRKKEMMAYIIIIILIILNLMIFGGKYYSKDSGWYDVKEMVEKNDILNYISKQPGIFRMHVYETTGIDWGTEFFNIPLEIESLYEIEGAWLSDYMNVYLSVAYRDPSKFWGILNVKYLTSQKELNISNFKFLGRFKDCDICFPDVPNLQKAWGPYLYQNEKFLPRAYIAPNSILVVGEKDKAMNIIYPLMLDNNYNPAATVVLLGKERINDYKGSDLNKYGAVFLTPGSVDQNSMYALKNYVDSGGILLPDITKGETSVSEEKIREILDLFSVGGTNISDDSVKVHSFDKIEIKLDKKQEGFLVYSSLFSMYPGWKVKADGKSKELLRADGVISAVYLDGDSDIIFEYKPKSYIIGSYITLITLILVIGYFTYRKFRK